MLGRAGISGKVCNCDERLSGHMRVYGAFQSFHTLVRLSMRIRDSQRIRNAAGQFQHARLCSLLAAQYPVAHTETMFKNTINFICHIEAST